MAETLWRLDPVRSLRVVRLAYEAAAEKKRFRQPVLTLATLPKQPHITKAGVGLVAERDGSVPRVHLLLTGSEQRIPDLEWQRPVAVDVARWAG